MLFALIVAFAPAPIAPPKPVFPSPVGQWQIEWRGNLGVCLFAADGNFTCFWQGSLWTGHWKMAAGVISVTEWKLAEGHMEPISSLKWKAVLEPRSLKGKVKDSSSFALSDTFALRKLP